MKPIQLAGAAALCGALLFTGCAKKTDQSTSTTTASTDATTAAGATPAADAAATTAPASDASTAPAATAAATTSSSSVTASSSSGNGTSTGYIDMPVYPGSTEDKAQELNASGNGTSVEMKVFTTKDDAKKVAEWYRAHLPASWKNSIFTVGGKTSGTFVDEKAAGDQSVLVTNADEGTTRIQLTTKHGK